MDNGLAGIAAQGSVGSAVYALLLAAAAAAMGLLGGWLGAYAKVKGENLATMEDFNAAKLRIEHLEQVKARVAVDTTVGGELRDASRQFAVAAGGMLHSMCWLTWDCRNRERLNTEMAKNYDTEAHLMSPQIIGQLTVIAMLDREVHDRLKPLADRIFELDAAVGRAVMLAEADPATGVHQLAVLNDEAGQVLETFRSGLVNLFKSSV